MQLGFYRTGNFFTDLGIVSLFDLFVTKYENLQKNSAPPFIQVSGKDIEFQLHKEFLIINAEKPLINDELKWTLEKLKEKIHSRETKSKQAKVSTWWSGAAWYLFCQMKWRDVESSMGQIFKTAKQGRECDLCGQKGRTLKDVGAVELPFAVSLQKFQSFYPSLKGRTRSCGCCRFASWFAPIWLHYRISNDVLNAFCLEANDLFSLYESWSYFSRMFAERRDLQTYESELYFVQLPYETVLDFLLSAWKIWKNDLIEKLGAKRMHLFSVEGRQENKTFKKHEIIPGLSRFLNALQRVVYQDSTGSEQQPLLTLFRAMLIQNPGNPPDTLYRNEFSRCCLFEEKLHDVLETFLCEKIIVREQNITSFEAREMERFFEIYQKEVIKMDEYILSSAKSIGQRLGQNMSKNADKSIVYELRNARSLTDYLEALQHIFVKNMEPTEEGITWYREEVENHLKTLDDKSWRVSRALTVIYTVLSYQQNLRSTPASTTSGTMTS